MPDNKPEPPHSESPKTSKSNPDVVKDAAKEATKPVKSKGYSNPALKMMGIPTLRLPSRNWMIFWTVLSIGTGGVAYDRYQQKQIRKKWMDRVAKFGEKKLGPNELARKVTVYVAPPPSDYLDESIGVFRRNVKPILNAAGIDFQIQSEDRQGVIRSVVAADIRALRREILDNEAKLQQLKNDSKWYNRVKNWLRKKTADRNVDHEALLNKKFTDDLNFANVLGVYYKNIHKDEKVKSEDSLFSDPGLQGGVICVGRGAYKEYLHGLHEGLLGPLDKPLDHKEFDEARASSEVKAETEIIEPPKVQSLNGIENIIQKDDPIENDNIVDADVNKIDETPTETISEDDEKKAFESELLERKSQFGDDEEETKKLPIPKPFISPEDYAKAKFAPEFDFNSRIPTSSEVSPFFQQPILVIPVYHLLGFLRTPERIYRFYTRRRLTEEFGKKTVALVENLYSPFSLNDIDLAKDEEEDWPKDWIKSGLEKQSEWTSAVVTDERVLSKLKVYDADRVITSEKK